MNILLTGSSGYIGSMLIPAFKAAGYKITGLDRLPPTTGKPDRFIQADLLDAGALDGVFDGIDLVVHLAAARVDWGLSDEGFFRDNLQATECLLDAGLKSGIGKWFIYSTVGVMPATREPLNETAGYAPKTAYGASKAEAEKRVLEASANDPSLEITILRPSAVFGPGNPPNTNIYRLIDSIYKRRFMMVGDGSALKTTSNHTNLVAATLFLMNRMKPGVETFIYVDQPVLPTDNLVEIIYDELGWKRPAFRLPLWLAGPISLVADGAAAVLGRDLPITSARIKKFCRSTNFSPAKLIDTGFVPPVEVEDAVRDTVKWYLETAEK